MDKRDNVTDIAQDKRSTLMDKALILHRVREHLAELLAGRKTPQMEMLWEAFLEIHQVDIADFLSDLDVSVAQQLFSALPEKIRHEVFQECSDVKKVMLLSVLSEQEQVDLFEDLSADELTDLFDYFSDEELKHYLRLLHKKVSEKVLSLLQFDPESAGGIMHTDVITLMQDFTVERSINLLQRLRPSKDIHQSIYVVDKAGMLAGFINLEDLVLHKPTDRIGSFMHESEFVAYADEDQEKVVKTMVHYGLMVIPVIDKERHFLGVISGETLVDVIMEEASEDVQKMAALAPMKYPYFETSFVRLVWERSYILIVLLLAESFSSNILHAYKTTLSEFLLVFIPMLISTGGNTSSQTSAMVIQGMASGDITLENVWLFLRRELAMSAVLGSILGLTSFVRVWLTGGTLLESFAISIVLSVIVMLAAVLGSGIPLILKRLNLDPAFSAGPFLATIMDILGVLIFCLLTKAVLFS